MPDFHLLPSEEKFSSRIEFWWTLQHSAGMDVGQVPSALSLLDTELQERLVDSWTSTSSCSARMPRAAMPKRHPLAAESDLKCL